MPGPTLAIREQCPNATAEYDGLMSAQYAGQLDGIAASSVVGVTVVGYTILTRPDPTTVGASPSSVVMVWNSTSKQPEWSDGTNWYDANGNVT